MKKILVSLVTILFIGIGMGYAQTNTPYEPITYYDLLKDAKRRERQKKREAKLLKRMEKPAIDNVEKSRRKSKVMGRKLTRQNNQKNRMMNKAVKRKKNNYGAKHSRKFEKKGTGKKSSSKNSKEGNHILPD